jgi:hypothetical protein
MMIWSDRVVESFPQPFNLIDPWMIDRSKEHLELGIVSEPALCDLAFMSHEVVDDEHETSGAAICAFDLVQQVNEQQGVLHSPSAHITLPLLALKAPVRCRI